MTQAANIKTDAVPHGSPYPANEIPGLVWGFRFVAGVPVPIRENSALDVQRHEWVWLHFSLADMRVQSWLAASNLVPKADLDHFLSKDDTQRLFSTGSCVAGAFFDLVHGFGHAEDEFGHLRFIMTDHLLITGRRRALASVETVRLSVASGRSFDSPVTLLNTLVEEIATSIDRIAEELSAEIDVVEDMVVKDMLPDDRQRLGRARLMSVRIHRRLNALRGLFRRIDAKEGGPMEALRAAGSRLVHRLDDLDHEVIELRDRARLLQEELSIRLAEQTNRQLRILSILTALLLPPSLIAGLFGMNVTALPFANSDSGFWWAIGLVVGASAIALWALKRAGILR